MLCDRTADRRQRELPVSPSHVKKLQEHQMPPSVLGDSPEADAELSTHSISVHDRREKPKLPSQLRSDTLMSHQSDLQHRSNLIPTRYQEDDTSRMNLAA